MSLSRDATQIDEENIGNTNTASTAPGPQHSPRHILKLDWTGMSPERAPRDVVWSVRERRRESVRNHSWVEIIVDIYKSIAN